MSRAQRSTKWCAADTDLGFTRDRHSNVRKSGKPDLHRSRVYPEIGAHMCASRASPTCVDRSSPWRSRISGAPLRSAPRCIASGTHDTDGHSCLTTSNNTHSLVAARFCVNALSPQHALAGPIPVFSCFSADSDLPSRVLRSQTTRTSPFQHALPPSRGAFCARGLHRCFTHPESRGRRSAEKRSGAQRNTRGAYHVRQRRA